MTSSALPSDAPAMGAPSLVSMSRRTAIKHVDDIMTFADLAPHLLPPIIKKVSSPTQLKTLETDSPQIVGLPATVELWKSFIRRDIPNWEKKSLEPRNPASWWKVYRKLKREDEAAQKLAEDQLKQALGKQAAQKESNKSTILHSVLPEARSSVKHLESGVNRKTVGMDALKALRRQTATTAMHRSVAIKFGGASSSRSAPAHRSAQIEMAANRGTVSQAPSKMVQEYARKAGVPSSAMPTNSAARFAASLSAPRSRPQMRNPFKSTAATNRQNQEALNLAIRIERETKARQQAEAQRRFGTARADRVSPPAPPSRSPEKRSHASSSNLEVNRASEKSKSPQPPAAEIARSFASPAAPVKRKAPNIFMAQKRRKAG
ncbi:putative RNA polymerase II transcription factor SIII (Elongin) subunit A [Elsinoe australis]|uniref:Putative RNA polymerase II transcription factor SIII (Elongin) subunit A n=1 Tax=Elsinoe australis TaxID=40998 RepID=A0A4U7AY97_9PEZI|nr:putative RNA polymerase II transcription factor SIII (Elongin) subunit A [Elsinoe australis]